MTLFVTRSRDMTVFETVQCLGAHAPDLPSSLRKAIQNAEKSDKALKDVEKKLCEHSVWRSIMGTTTSVNMIQGGIKANALPEGAWAVVNHRIDMSSSVGDVKKSDAKFLRDLAERFELSYTAFGERVTDGSSHKKGTLKLSDAFHSSLEPAPVSSTSGEQYKLLAGTIRATYDRHRSNSFHKKEMFVTPAMTLGNTDTQHYWDLSKHIFRYNHKNGGKDEVLAHEYTVNESIPVDAFLEMIEFFATLILNANEARFY
jgi:Gly-Xaa carboxypeptidase